MTYNCGYDFELVGDAIKDYECPICLLLIRDAVMLPCSHTLCQSCIEKWEEGTKNNKIKDDNNNNGNEIHACPTCKTVYQIEKVQRLIVIDRIITSSKVKCKKIVDGCDWVGTINDYKYHEENTCKHVLVRCIFDGCNTEWIRHQLDEHKASCLYQLVGCEYCNEKFGKKYLEAHFSYCLSYSVICPNDDCGRSLPRKEISTHLENDCDYSYTICRYNSMGCNVMVKRKDMENHLSEFTEEHMSCLFQHTSNLTKTLQKTTEDLQATKEQLKVSEKKLEVTQKHVAELREELKSADKCCFSPLISSFILTILPPYKYYTVGDCLYFKVDATSNDNCDKLYLHSIVSEDWNDLKWIGKKRLFGNDRVVVTMDKSALEIYVPLFSDWKSENTKVFLASDQGSKTIKGEVVFNTSSSVIWKFSDISSTEYSSCFLIKLENKYSS